MLESAVSQNSLQVLEGAQTKVSDGWYTVSGDLWETRGSGKTT